MHLYSELNQQIEFVLQHQSLLTNPDVSTGITAYGISDVKAVYVEGVARDPSQGPWQDFSGDVVQRDIKVIGIASITSEFEWDSGPNSGICTVTVPAKSTLVVLGKDSPIYLEEGDKITAGASAADDLHLTVSYEEIDDA